MMDITRIVGSSLDRIGRTRRRSSFILADRSLPGHGNHVLFVFLDGSPTPGLVIKVAGDSDRAAALRREADNLARIAGAAGQAFLHTVPTVLHLGNVGERLVQVQTAMPGATMTRQPGSYFSARRFGDGLRGVLAWLAAIEAEPLDDLPVAAEALGSDGPAAAIAAFRARHLRSARLDDLLDWTCAQLDDGSPALVPRHGDFCAANVMLTGPGRIGVIDWEAALERTWPLADLVYFLASIPPAPTGCGKRAWLDGYRRFMFGTDPRLRSLQRQVQRAVRSPGLAPETCLVSSVIAWVVYANRKQVELDTMEANSGVRLDDEAHLPLICLEDGHCLNLELLAERRSGYLLSRS